MMNGFRCAALVGIAMMGLVGGAVLIGRTAPTRAESRLAGYGFAVCDDQPCVGGILPGTRWENPAFVALRQREDCKEDALGCRYFVRGGPSLAFDKTAYAGDKSYLEVITLDMVNSAQPLYLEDVLRLYGVPCKLRIFRDTQSAQLWSDYGMTYIKLVDGRIDLGSRVFVMNAYQTRECSEPLQRDEFRWQGFTSTDVYFTRQLLQERP